MLFPYSLRDTLLRAAEMGAYQMYLSDEILEEMRRNLVETGTTTEEKSLGLVLTIKEAFPEAVATGYEHLVASMPNDLKDRHVSACAVHVGAQVIVTRNLRHFNAMPDGIEAQHPDEFLSNLFDLDPEGMVRLLHEQAAALVKRPVTFEQLVAGLAKIVPRFAALVRDYVSDA